VKQKMFALGESADQLVGVPRNNQWEPGMRGGRIDNLDEEVMGQ